MRHPDTSTSGLPAPLSDSTGFVLSKAAQRAADLTEAALRPFGLKPRHYGVLVVLRESGTHSQQQIGERLQIDRTTMAAIADDLERLGLAERRPYPGNRRAHALQLTPAGEQRLPRLVAVVQAAEQTFLAPLGPTEREQLYASVSSLAVLDPRGPEDDGR